MPEAENQTPPNRAQFGAKAAETPKTEADCPMEDLAGHNFRSGPVELRYEPKRGPRA